MTAVRLSLAAGSGGVLPQGDDDVVADPLGVAVRLREFHALIEAAAGNEQLAAMLARASAFSRDERLAAANELVAARRGSLLARYDDHRRLAQAMRAG